MALEVSLQWIDIHIERWPPRLGKWAMFFRSYHQASFFEERKCGRGSLVEVVSFANVQYKVHFLVEQWSSVRTCTRHHVVIVVSPAMWLEERLPRLNSCHWFCRFQQDHCVLEVWCLSERERWKEDCVNSAALIDTWLKWDWFCCQPAVAHHRKANAGDEFLWEPNLWGVLCAWWSEAEARWNLPSVMPTLPLGVIQEEYPAIGSRWFKRVWKWVSLHRQARDTPP